MDSILLYTDDNIIGQSIHDYMIDRARDITTLKFQDIVKGVGASPAATVIINIIHKDISAATTVALLNTLRKRLTHCALLVLIVKSELSSLFRELLDLENLLILNRKILAGRLLSHHQQALNRRRLPGAMHPPQADRQGTSGAGVNYCLQ
ncbi:response regulator [Klebsiella michiganensis]|uniref:Response regulator n=1 Tax=Klebsiella michiganensis TaxID=1134687 RepID=A0A7H4PIG0_9ENTR|nr:response regulator [Klebsiella michiganensis]